MAQRGRKPTPTAIKELEGNPGKRPLNDAEPKPERKAPPCPKWLEPEAKKEWRRLSKQLEQIGVLTEVDQAAFASYCQAYARWKEAEEFMTQHGTIVKTKSGYWQQVPQVSIAQTYLKIMETVRKIRKLGVENATEILSTCDKSAALVLICCFNMKEGHYKRKRPASGLYHCHNLVYSEEIYNSSEIVGKERKPGFGRHEPLKKSL